MPKRPRRLRKAALFGLNLLLIGLVVLNGSAVVSPINRTQGLSFPENALVYDVRLDELRINQLIPDVSPTTDPVDHLQDTLATSDEPLRLDVTLAGTLTVYLLKADDEVLTDAQVTAKVPVLNVDCALRQQDPGVYACNFEQRAVLSSAVPVSETDPNLRARQVKPMGLRLNNRLQEVFSFAGYVSQVPYANHAPSTSYDIPLDIRTSFQLVDKDDVPVAGWGLPLQLRFSPQETTEAISLRSDSQGVVTYQRGETITVSFSGGRLKPLRSPVEIPEAQHRLRLTDHRGRTHLVWVPLARSGDSPPITIFWGGGDNRRPRPAPEGRGKPGTDKELGQDQRNPPAGADPISMTVGNVYTQAVDVRLPSRGLPIAFERTYNSLEAESGPLGFGWTHPYHLRVTLDEAETTAAVKLEDGRRVFFTKDANGNFVAPKGEYSRLVRNSDNTWTFTTKHGQVYAFDSVGRLTAIKDRNGNAVTLTYNTAGRLITIAGSGTRKLELAYNTNNRITSVTLPNTTRIQYQYDSEGNLTSVTDAAGKVTKYQYDPHHLLEVLTDPNGHNRSFGYDWFGRGISFAYDYNNHKVSVSYDEANQKTSVTDSRGQKTEYHYQVIDGLKLIRKTVDAVLNEETVSWDTNLNRTATTDQRGTTTSMTYDARGNLLTTSVPDPRDPQRTLVTQFTYEPTFHLVTRITDPLNQATAFTYDASGNLTKTTDALGQATTFTYDAFGQLTKVTNPRAQSTTFTYTAVGDLETITDALGQATTFTYDAVGNRTAVTDARSNTTRFEYDANQRLTKITYPDTTATIVTYDAVGNRTVVKDALGNETRYEYDAVDRLSRVVDALNRATTYQYDTEGNLLAVTDAAAHQTRYEYDLLNRLIKTLNALEIAEAYQYDPVGNRTRRTDGNGAVTSYTYDTLNRLTKIAYPDASTVEFTYDALSRLEAMTDPRGRTTSAYDALGRLTSADGPLTSDTVRYEYDAVGNRTTLTDPDGAVTRYAYDGLDRLQTITDPQGGVATYQYDAVGNVTTLTLPNRLTATSTYDALSRLVSLAYANQAQQTLLRSQYTYDVIGRRTKLTGTVPGSSGTVSVTADYAYDALSQLTSESRTGTSPYTRTYAYDTVGNRTSVTRDGTTRLSTYNALNQLLEEQTTSAQSQATVTVTGTVDDATATVRVQNQPATVSAGQFQVSVALARGTHRLKAEATDPAGNASLHQIDVEVLDPLLRSYAYDRHGSLTQQTEGPTTTSFTYDVEHRLTQIQGLSPQGTVPLASYTYDGQGLRVSATESGVTTTSVFDGLLPLVERQGGGTTRNTWGLSYGGGIGGLLSRTTSAGTLFPLYDGSGNILAWTDANGQVVSSTASTAFGEVVTQSGPAQPYSFSTKPFNSATSLSYFGARYYRPDLGRWLTPDPLGMVDGPNVYAYVRNNPINRLDPWGLYTGPKPHVEGSGEFRERIEQSMDKVGTTRRGRELIEETAKKGTRIRETKNDAYYRPSTNEIRIDPGYHPMIKTTQGRIPASTERILAHEMEHAAGTRDEWEAVQKGENPVAIELGQPERTEY